MKKAILITSMIIPAFFVLISGLQNTCSAVLLDRVVATVNNEVITWSELMHVITHEGREYLSNAAPGEKEEKIKEIERPFLDKMIEMKLQLQEAGKMGLHVDSDEIDGAVSEIRVKYKMNDEMFAKSLQAEGLTMQDYRKRLSDQILLQKVVNFAVKADIVISDKEIGQYYEDNRAEFSEKERLKVSQIFFAKPDNESEKTVVDARAQEVMKRIERGEDFASLAGEFSEDPSRHFGGDIGYVSRGAILKEIEDVAFSLKVGEVSRPFWSTAGLHIIKIEERSGGGGMEKAKERIKEKLFMKKFELKHHEWLTGLRENAYIEIKL